METMTKQEQQEYFEDIKLATTPSNNDDIYRSLKSFIEIHNEDKLIYDFTDFHLGLIRDFARSCSGEIIYKDTEKIKEVGYTLLMGACVQFSAIHRCHKHIRYVHSSVDIGVEFLTAIYNFFLKPEIIATYGLLVDLDSGKKFTEKKRYTQRLLQLKNGVTIRASTQLQYGTGTTDLQSGYRPDLLILDDMANMSTAESKVKAVKHKKVTNELISGLDQTSGSVFSARNPTEGIDHVVESIEADERFEKEKVFLYRPDGSLFWKATDTFAGKYLETDEDVADYMNKYPHRPKPVSVERLRMQPNFNTVFLGIRINPEDLFIQTKQKPMAGFEKIRVAGVEVNIFQRPKKNHKYGIITDSSEGVGKHNQALLVRDYTDNEIVATVRNNRINTDTLAEIVYELHEDYNKAVIFPENDGKQGMLLIEYLKKEYNITLSIGRMRRKDFVTQVKASRKLGYIPSATANKRIYKMLQRNIDEVKINCPLILNEISMFTYIAYKENANDPGDGHFDLLRTLAISEGMADDITRMSINPIFTLNNP